MGAYVDDQTRPTHSLVERTNIESLPEDVVFDILARVPALDIHYAGRLVCHKWYQTICTHDFVRAHLQQSTFGLVIQHINTFDRSKTPHKPLLFATQKGRIIEKSNFISKDTGYAFSSCNGLILESKLNLEFRITNPVTKHHLDLPSIGMGKHSTLGMAYAVASKKYKVVRSFYNMESREEECVILTVGVDEDWKRRVDIKHLSPTAKMLLRLSPTTTPGFVNWAAQHSSSWYPECVLTLNIETEIITRFPAFPASLLCGCDGETNLLYRYLPMGSCLSLLIARDNEFPILDQVWAMKPETGEWTKIMSIDSESQKRAFEGVLSAPLNYKLRPVGWLKFREVLVFCDSKWYTGKEICIAYNVRTHEIELFELGFCPYNFVVHRNSLVSVV